MHSLDGGCSPSEEAAGEATNGKEERKTGEWKDDMDFKVGVRTQITERPGMSPV